MEPGLHANMEGLISILDGQHYTRLLMECDRVDMLVAQLHDGDVHQAASLYTNLCKKLTAQVVQYVRRCRYGLLPYVRELIGKKESGHGCIQVSTISGIRHNEQISEITTAHSQIQATLMHLAAIRPPATQSVAHARSIDELYKQIEQLRTGLRELFTLEESELIPGLISLRTGSSSQGFVSKRS